MSTRFLKYRQQILRRRENDFIVLYETIQDLKEGRISESYFQSVIPVLQQRLGYYTSSLSGLEYGFLKYFIEHHSGEISFEFSIGSDENIEHILSSRLTDVNCLLENEGVLTMEQYLSGDGEEEQIPLIAQSFIEHVNLGYSMAEETSLKNKEVKKVYTKIKNRKK